MDHTVKPPPVQEPASVKPTEQFAMLPRYWFSLGLTGRQFRVGAAILLHFNPKYPDKCFPSIELIHDITGVDVRHVRRDIKALKLAGAIDVRRVTNKVNGKNRSSNHYRPGTGAETAHGPKQPGAETCANPGLKLPREPRAETAPLTDQGINQPTDHGALATIVQRDLSAEDLAGELFDRSLAEGLRAKHELRKRAAVMIADVSAARIILDEYGLDDARRRAGELIIAISAGRVTRRELTCNWLLETWSWNLKTTKKASRDNRTLEPRDKRDVGGKEAVEAIDAHAIIICGICDSAGCESCRASRERKSAAQKALAARKATHDFTGDEKATISMSGAA